MGTRTQWLTLLLLAGILTLIDRSTWMVFLQAYAAGLVGAGLGLLVMPQRRRELFQRQAAEPPGDSCTF